MALRKGTTCSSERDSEMKDIWKKEISPEILAEHCRDTAVAHLGIEIISVGPDFITATMPVDSRTRQPFGKLHGGASVLLAESLGSMGTFFSIDETRNCVGMQICANHLKGVRSGKVTGTARPVHMGQSTHVWDITIEDEEKHLICSARLTTAILY